MFGLGVKVVLSSENSNLNSIGPAEFTLTSLAGVLLSKKLEV